MGYDISYHPVSEQQIHTWYFDILKHPETAKQVAEAYGVEEFYWKQYEETVRAGLSADPDVSFDQTHGHFIATVQGYFEQYFYVRGAALSFAGHPDMAVYYKPWQYIVPKFAFTQTVHNRITANYSSGVYIPPHKVDALLGDYERRSSIASVLDELFSDGRMAILLKALRYASSKRLGLLEATEVVEPNPLDLDGSSCYSNLLNCDPAGALLYRETALAQLAEVERKENLEPGTIASKASYEVRSTPEVKKQERKGFWKKLFGK